MNRTVGKIISMIVAITAMILSFCVMELVFIHNFGYEQATTNTTMMVLLMIAFGFGLAGGKMVRMELVK